MIESEAVFPVAVPEERWSWPPLFGLLEMVLEMVSEGAAVTTKYTLFVAASNLAISYVTALNGNAAHFRVFGTGARASIVFDGVITYAGIAAVAVLFALFLRKKPQGPVTA